MVEELKVGMGEPIVKVLGYLDINCIQVVEELKVGTNENIVIVLGIPGYKLIVFRWLESLRLERMRIL